MTTSSRSKKKLGSIFLYRTDRGILDRLDVAAKKAGISPPRMLDKMINAWVDGYVSLPKEPTKAEKQRDDEIPWYLKNSQQGVK